MPRPEKIEKPRAFGMERIFVYLVYPVMHTVICLVIAYRLEGHIYRSLHDIPMPTQAIISQTVLRILNFPSVLLGAVSLRLLPPVVNILLCWLTGVCYAKLWVWLFRGVRRGKIRGPFRKPKAKR